MSAIQSLKGFTPIAAELRRNARRMLLAEPRVAAARVLLAVGERG